MELNALTVRGIQWLALQAVMAQPRAMERLKADHSLISGYQAPDVSRGLELQVVPDGAPELDFFIQACHNSECDPAPYAGDPYGLELTYRVAGGFVPVVLVERTAPHEPFTIIVWPVTAFLGYEEVRNLILAEIQSDAEQDGVA